MSPGLAIRTRVAENQNPVISPVVFHRVLLSPLTFYPTQYPIFPTACTIIPPKSQYNGLILGWGKEFTSNFFEFCRYWADITLVDEKIKAGFESFHTGGDQSG